MGSLLSNELIKIKLNPSRNQGDHPRQTKLFSKSKKFFEIYSNIKNENNGIKGMRPSENGYGYNNVPDQPPQIMEEQPFQFSAILFESYDKFVGGQNDEDDQEEFMFPFNEKEDHGNLGIHVNHRNNMNTQGL